MSDDISGSNQGDSHVDEYEEENEEEEEEHQISFASYQLFVFVTCYVAYCVMLYNRKSFTYTLPHVILEEYFSSYEVGMILSAQTCTYTISRCLSSWATDHYSPRLMLSTGIFFTGLVMLAFTEQEDWPNIMLLTASNGVAQGLGWPAVTKMIRSWYPSTQFGLWYALMSTASNLTSTIGPGIATALAVTHGWRSALQYPGMLALLMSAAIPFCTWNTPSDVGYEDQITLAGGNFEGHWSDLAGSDFLMMLTASFCGIFVVKTSCQDWGQMYLLQERGLSAYSATAYLNSMEVGGLLGCIVVGALTDFMIRRGYYFGTGKSPRMIIAQLCIAGSCLFLNLFLFTIEPETSQTYMITLGFMMGFCMYGSISLLGTVAVEVAPIHMTGSAHAIVGLAANIGVVASGVPISYIASCFDWFTAFMLINGLGMIIFFMLVLGKDIKATYIQAGGGPPKLRAELRQNKINEMLEKSRKQQD